MENTKNTIAAIIKTANSEKYLCNTLESIKELDEVFIIDENSTDDTIAIAKEYKTKIIYSNKGELLTALEQALQESKSEWVFVIQDREIIPQKLIYEIKKYTSSPKKNKNALTVPLKTFYFGNEIKSSSKKKLLRIFKKGACIFTNNHSITEIKLKQGKIHNINPNFKLKNGYILSYFENDIAKNLNNILEKNKIKLKTIEKTNFSIFYKPIFAFLKNYFLKGGIFDGRWGYILSVQKFIEEFSMQLMIKNKDFKGENNDIW